MATRSNRRISGLGQRSKHNRARKAAIQLTKRELSKLSNYELKDIGIGRSDITSIANGTFYDARDTNVNKNLKDGSNDCSNYFKHNMELHMQSM